MRQAVAADRLQAQGFLPVPDARHVYRRTDALDRVRSRWLIADWVFAHLVVQSREIAAGQVEVEMNQFPIRFENKK